MIFTQQRRRAMNKRLKERYPNIEFYEAPNGIPVMECSQLPEGAVRILDADEFLKTISITLRKKNSLGLTLTDYSKSFPVFIESMELKGNQPRYYFRVNYIWGSLESQRKAREYIADGKLYAVI